MATVYRCDYYNRREAVLSGSAAVVRDGFAIHNRKGFYAVCVGNFYNMAAVNRDNFYLRGISVSAGITLRALLSGVTLVTFGTLFSGVTLVAFGTLFSGVTFLTFGALFTGITFLAFGTLLSGIAFFTLRALLAGITLFTLRTLLSGLSIR